MFKCTCRVLGVFNLKYVSVSRLYILETPELCLNEYDSWFHTFVLNISGSSCIGLNTNVGWGGQVLKVSSLNLLNSLLTLLILMVLFCAKMYFFFLGFSFQNNFKTCFVWATTFISVAQPLVFYGLLKYQIVSQISPRT